MRAVRNIRSVAAGSGTSELWCALGAYLAVIGGLTTYRWHIWMYGSDTGTFCQTILNAFRGFRNGPEHGSHFVFHFSPILATLFPLLSATHSGLVLQLAQVVLVACCAPALYVLMRNHVSAGLATRLAMLPLVYPPLVAIAFEEFHEVAFYPALAIAMLCAADRKRWSLFACLALACLLIREDINLELAAIGTGLVLFVLRWRRAADGVSAVQSRHLMLAGGALGAAGVASVAVYYYSVFAVERIWPHGHFYDYSFGHGPAAVMAALFLHPFLLASSVFTFGRFTYVAEALLPLALLPLRTPWSLTALPAFAVVLLSSDPSVWRMGFHYAGMWTPWLLVSSAVALTNIERKSGTHSARRWLNLSLAACALTLMAFNPLHLTHYLRPAYVARGDAAQALACVPRDASVSTHDEWFSIIAARYPAATFFATDGVDYMVFADDYQNVTFRRTVKPRLDAALAAHRYRVVCQFGQVKTYRRVRPLGM